MAGAVEWTEVSPGTGLYAAGAAVGGQPVSAYYLLVTPASPPLETITFEESWQSPVLAGWYIFLGTPVPASGAGRFAAQARVNLQPLLPSPQNGDRAIVWLSDPSDWSGRLPAVPLRVATTYPVITRTLPPDIKTFPFTWPPFVLGVTQNASFGMDAAGGGFQITAALQTPSQVTVAYGAQPQNILGYYTTPRFSWVIDIPAAGLAAGSLCFSLGLDLGGLQQAFACAFQYFYEESGAGTLTYPLLPTVSPSSVQQHFIGFDIRLNPIFPDDPLVTSFDLDLDSSFQFAANSRALVSKYFFTTTGGAITLVPHDVLGSPAGSGPPVIPSPGAANPLAAGFSFGRAPYAPGSPSDFQFYLAPKGAWRIAAVSTPAGSALAPGDSFEWMCGFFGKEYLQLQDGDLIEFVGSKPAYAAGFPPESITSSPGDDTAGALTDRFTTSWAQYDGDSGGRGFFAQPASSVYFGETGSDAFPTAVRAMVNDLTTPSPFPMVPYGGVFQPPSGRPANAALLGQFESSVLSSVRGSQLAVGTHGPRFLPPENAPRGATMRSAVTPQGLLVGLNTEDGTWQSLTLADSPLPNGGSLQFTPSAGMTVVSPLLSNVLLQNDLFLVVSRPGNVPISPGGTLLGDFQNAIDVGGFNFDLDVGPGATVLIFKFNTTASLAALAEQPSLWAEAATFVEDAAATQQVIRRAIQTARQDAGATGNPFGFFNLIANLPEWTGVLALNCAINGNGIPPDFQMLLGGIQGTLRAHHFGVEVNRVEPTSGGRLAIQQSSIFGVIHYDNPAPSSSSSVDLDYEVETLTVVFSNSAITQFAVQVGLTINRLLGRTTRLTPQTSPSANTLVIAGQYQKQGAIGTVTFATDTPFLFEMPARAGEVRIVQQVQIHQASLTPVSSTPLSAGTAVVAEFAMSGMLWFNPDPFPASDGLDLFSYGIAASPPAGGLAFTGMTVTISFDLDAAGAMTPGSKTVTLNPTSLSFTPSASAIRPRSFLASLPLQFSRFVYSQGGLTKSLTGASPIHVLQLEGGRAGEAGASPAIAPAAPGVNSNPQYALEYDMPLGSLGSLSDVQVGIMAKLLLAWGPSPLVPDSDAAAVLVQLPSLSAGLAGFTLQGILQTTFGDANLLKVVLPSGETVYAVTFTNVQLSVFGFTFPPGLLVDFVIFAGSGGQDRNTSNVAWFLSAQQT